jgi:hypothetical protein
MVMDTSCFGVTVNQVSPEIVPAVATMLVTPSLRVAACPLCGVTVATAGARDSQVTCVVIFSVLALSYSPVAVNCTGKPLAMNGDSGVTVMVFSSLASTVKLVEPVISPTVALMSVRPSAAVVAWPVVAPIIATASEEESHRALTVRSADDPSL